MIKYYDMSAITKRVRDATKVSLDDIMNQNKDTDIQLRIRKTSKLEYNRVEYTP